MKSRQKLALLLSLALAACGQAARNETSEAADTLTADMNASRAEAARDVERADAMLGASNAAIADPGNRIAEAADNANEAN